jgi:hypothetical protein
MDAENTAEVSNEQTQVDADKFYGEADESNEVDAASVEESKEEEESVGTIADGDIESEDSKEESSEEEEDASKESEDAKDEEDFELELPEGSILNAQQIEEVKQFAKENNLSNEVAQKILESNHSVAQNLVQQAQERQAELQASWKADTLKDAELGGENLKIVSENAKRVLDRFGNDEIKKLLRDTRYGDHKEVIRMFNNIGKAMSEDNLILGSGKTKTEKSFEERFYNGN